MTSSAESVSDLFELCGDISWMKLGMERSCLVDVGGRDVRDRDRCVMRESGWRIVGSFSGL